MSTSKDDEIIGYVSRKNLEELGFLSQHPSILTSLPEGYITQLTSHIAWGKRGPLEHDPENKQLIPYIILWRSGERGKELFVMTRKRAQREARLHDKLSIGVGGHINPLEDDEAEMHGEVITLNAWRELEEEVSLQGELSWRALRWKPLGLLNDDRDEVGRVHLGVVFTMEIPPDHEVIVRETDKLEGRWCCPEEIDMERLETWSQLSMASSELEMNS